MADSPSPKTVHSAKQNAELVDLQAMAPRQKRNKNISTVAMIEWLTNAVTAYGAELTGNSSQPPAQAVAPVSPSKVLVECAWDAIKHNENLQPQELAAAQKIF
jgi:hypothetical protein